MSNGCALRGRQAKQAHVLHVGVYVHHENGNGSELDLLGEGSAYGHAHSRAHGHDYAHDHAHDYGHHGHRRGHYVCAHDHDYAPYHENESENEGANANDHRMHGRGTHVHLKEVAENESANVGLNESDYVHGQT